MVKNIYMKVIGSQTKTVILPGQNVPHFTGEMVILVSKINKYHFLYIILLMKIKRNIVIFLTHFLVKTKQKNA